MKKNMIYKIEQGKQLKIQVFGEEFSEASSEYYPPMLDFLDSTFADLYGANIKKCHK